MSKLSKVVIVIDESRNRFGGSKAHLIGILASLDPYHHGINQINVLLFKFL